MDALGVLLLKSVGAGYGAANIAGRNEKLRILEFAPLGTKAHILILGPQQDVQNFIVGLRTSDIERSIVLDNVSEKVLQAYAGQNNSNMKEFLLIFESQFIGDLFYFSSQFMNLGLEVVDFRAQRISESPGLLIMTGTDAEGVKQTAQDLKRQNVKITFLSNLSKNFRNYFDVEIN